MTTTAAAPSFKLEEFPAVTEPSLTNAGRSLASFSMVSPSLGPSSVSKTVTFPFLSFSSTGRISSANFPLFTASTARLWLSSAKASCSSLLTPNRFATFSAVVPLWELLRGQVRMSMTPSSKLLCPILAPQRASFT